MVNRKITIGDAGGWINQWEYYGGRYAHTSTEGTEVAGVKHIEATTGHTRVMNTHNFWGASLEGDVEEYQVDIGGAFFTFWGCRWETTGGARVKFSNSGATTEGSDNAIMFGTYAESIIVTKDAGANHNKIYASRGATRIPSQNLGLALQNSGSSTYPALVTLAADANLYAYTRAQLMLESYSSYIGARKIGGKRTADEHDRAYLDVYNGRIYFGSGAAAAAFSLRYAANGITVDGAALGVGGAPDANLILDAQSTTKAFAPPRMTTAQRGALTGVAGGMVYDTDLNKMAFYNGSAWEVITSAIPE